MTFLCSFFFSRDEDSRQPTHQVQNDRMYHPGSESGPVIGEGYGAELRRKDLYEAYKKYLASTGGQRSQRRDDPGPSGDPLFGQLDPVALLDLLFNKRGRSDDDDDMLGNNHLPLNDTSSSSPAVPGKGDEKSKRKGLYVG